MAGGLVATTLAVFLVAGTALVHAQMSTEPRAAAGGEAVIPRPEVARVASLGFRSLVSDYYWLRAVQLAGGQGGQSGDPTQHAVEIGRLIDLVTHLDPWVDHPYRFAAIWLTKDEASVRQANELLRRGIVHHPDEWRNLFYLGFNHFFYLQENVEAADALERASKISGSPRYLPRLVARLRSESSNLEAAEVFLMQLSGEAPDEATRATYQSALDEIEMEKYARFLERARDAFRDIHGRDIARVEELLLGENPVLASLPPAEPASMPVALRRGSRWILDPESERILTTFYGRRYEVNFHGQDRRRIEASSRERNEEGTGDDS